MTNTDFTLCGNLTAEPFFKRFNSGATLLRLRVASSDARKTTNDKGEEVWVDYNQLYVDVECWGQMAVNAGASLRKGFPVVVVGKLVSEFWEEKDEDGKEANVRSRLKMNAKHIAFDLARFQVNSVRATVTGNAIEGHDKPSAMDAEALDKKINGENANPSAGRDQQGPSPHGSWGAADPSQERRVSAEDMHRADAADATNEAPEEDKELTGAPF